MAKRDEYPLNTHIVARLQAICAALGANRNCVEMFNNPSITQHIPPKIMEILQHSIDRANETYALASRAMSGDDTN